VVDALEFLAGTIHGDGDFSGARHVVVAGGGNTAMDAVRRASRLAGVETLRCSYRRSRADMPAEREEVELALREAEAMALAAALGAGRTRAEPALVEMSQPERLEPGRLILRLMEAGAPDSSGRRAPVASDRTLELPCDLLILAIGELPDPRLLQRLGASIGKDGRPLVELPSGAAGQARRVFVVGDARRGPASIIAAEADGRAAAQAIMADAGIGYRVSSYAPPEPRHGALAARGDLAPALAPADPAFLAREASRCLECDSVCERCVEVCPNRAYVAIPAGPGERMAQILQVDALCNECGNCGSFCPWEGEPWKGKPGLFADAAALSAASKAGFAIGADLSLSFRAEIGGGMESLPFDAWFAQGREAGASRRIQELARRVLRDHAYLLPRPAMASGKVAP
jgi:putative selenate reductase